jgi:hypothetical protein
MKTLIAFAALVLCIAAYASAQTICQYVTLATDGSTSGSRVNFSVQTNQIITIVGYDWLGRPGVYGYLPNGAATVMTPYYSTIVTSSLTTQIFTGLTNILVGNITYGTGDAAPSATFKIETPAVTTVISNYVPADAIVIPASATGNVQIILESSPDLVNWTAASPGTYSASAGTNRFFRVRAVVSP